MNIIYNVWDIVDIYIDDVRILGEIIPFPRGPVIMQISHLQDSIELNFDFQIIKFNTLYEFQSEELCEDRFTSNGQLYAINNNNNP